MSRVGSAGAAGILAATVELPTLRWYDDTLNI
jgi:hypothetical protein